MNDSGPEIEALLKARYETMSGSERALLALQMFETAQQIVLSSLTPALSEDKRRRELCRRFYGDELARATYPETGSEVCVDRIGARGRRRQAGLDRRGAPG